MVVFSGSGAAGFGVGLLGELAGFHISNTFFQSWLLSSGAQPAFAVCLSVVKTLRMPRRRWHVSSQTFRRTPKTPELLDWPDLARSPQADQDCEDLIVAV